MSCAVDAWGKSQSTPGEQDQDLDSSCRPQLPGGLAQSQGSKRQVGPRHQGRIQHSPILSKPFNCQRIKSSSATAQDSATRIPQVFGRIPQLGFRNWDSETRIPHLGFRN